MTRLIFAALTATCLLSFSAQAQTPAVVIEQAWSRATPGGVNIGVAYIVAKNAGATTDRLIGGATDIAQRLELHEMAMDGGIMKMRPLTNGIEIAPGAKTELRPGGNHIMLMGLKQPLKAGDSFKAVLQFEKAGAVPVTFSVQGVGASAPEMDHSKHMQMK